MSLNTNPSAHLSRFFFWSTFFGIIECVRLDEANCDIFEYQKDSNLQKATINLCQEKD